MIFSIGNHIEQIKNGTKTQTRRIAGWATFPQYQVGKTYAVQSTRGGRGIPDGRIKIIEIRKEMGVIRPSEFISVEDAEAEGGYAPTEFEALFRKMYPRWTARFAYTFEFIPSSEFKEKDE